MKPLLTAYLDSSVILSGLASPNGGSGMILRAGKLKKLKLITTVLVIREVARHLSKLEIDPKDLENLLSTKTVILKKKPSNKSQEKFSEIVADPNDVHVIAGAAFSGADFLVSLDKKHILVSKVKKYLRPMMVLNPKDFWNQLRK